MRLIPLGSGSQGNATFVELGGRRLLVDAGLSARQLKLRLEAVGVEPDTIDAILLSHEHTDHAQGAERFSRKHSTPVVCSGETLEAMECSPAHFATWLPLPESGDLEIEGSVRVHAFPVPHDAARPVGFVLEADGMKAGFVTDLGHATTVVVERLRDCDAIMVESNYDRAMLLGGPYPWSLKQRVTGRLGHLSNDGAAALLREVVSERCRAVVLCHLSEQNNTPALARETAARALQWSGNRRVEMRVARRRRPTPALEL